MSHWLTIIRLMNLILTLLLGLQPLAATLPILPKPQVEPLTLVLRTDYGLALAPAKKSRLEKLAAALSARMHR